jgi:hypothetical protein
MLSFCVVAEDSFPAVMFVPDGGSITTVSPFLSMHLAYNLMMSFLLFKTSLDSDRGSNLKKIMSLFTFYHNLPYSPTALLLRDFLLTNSQHDHEKKCYESYIKLCQKATRKNHVIL